mmetsp:Transcript_113009/g.326557  ORF Transcript_113009/g.326557 Transcript_113009/m.326557 type:complete len:247 (+) Transcript_113009:85-825(+)
MGATCSRNDRRAAPIRESVPVPVTLHIYNLGSNTQAVNSMLRKIGTGAFHCGVEVYGIEWSFSDVDRPSGAKGETGVFCCPPRQCDGHSYCESIPMGATSMVEAEVLELLLELKREWLVSNYDTLRKNCCHFCEEFCQRLGVGSLPHWVKNLANVGVALVAAAEVVCCQALSKSPSAMMFCCGHAPRPREKYAEVVNADVVQAMPVLPPMGGGAEHAASDDESDFAVSAGGRPDPWDVPGTEPHNT